MYDTQSATAATSAAVATLIALLLGCFNDGSNNTNGFFDGAITEVVICATALNATDLAAWRNHQKEKWATP